MINKGFQYIRLLLNILFIASEYTLLCSRIINIRMICINEKEVNIYLEFFGYYEREMLIPMFFKSNGIRINLFFLDDSLIFSNFFENREQSN